MTDEDRARASERLLSDPVLVEALSMVRRDAIERVLLAQDDDTMRRARDEALALDSFVNNLRNAILKAQSANRPRVERA